MNQAELENSRARLSLAESELQRVETLLERRAVSRGDFDKVKAEADRSRAEVAQREAELGRAVAGSREEEILAAQAQVEAAAARADQLRDALDRHIVRAPFAGVVGQKMTEEGEWVRVGDPLFALADARDLYIEVNAPERHFNQIRADASATVEFDAAGSETVQGRVSRIVPLVDAASRTFPVRIDIDNSRLTVAPGMFGRASLKLSAATASGEAEPSQDALVVPKDAVVLDPGGKRKVWLVRPAGPGTKAFPVEVKTGRQHLDMIEILEGELREGDVAVIRGNERLLFPGQDVVIENPAPQPEAR
jgi:RND family efflux transporter MFP subunit